VVRDHGAAGYCACGRRQACMRPLQTACPGAADACRLWPCASRHGDRGSADGSGRLGAGGDRCLRVGGRLRAGAARRHSPTAGLTTTDTVKHQGRALCGRSPRQRCADGRTDPRSGPAEGTRHGRTVGEEPRGTRVRLGLRLTSAMAACTNRAPADRESRVWQDCVFLTDEVKPTGRGPRSSSRCGPWRWSWMAARLATRTPSTLTPDGLRRAAGGGGGCRDQRAGGAEGGEIAARYG